MSTFQKFILSASTDGRPIKIAANATPGTTIHTASATSGVIDEIYVWFTNTDSVARNVTIEWGGTTNPDDHLTHTFSLDAVSEPTLLVPGLILQNGLLVKAFASVANVIVVTGFVNRIFP